MVGFAVLGLPPIPLFSTYGVISAVAVPMAGLAALLALLALPAMLLVVARMQRGHQ